MAALFPGGSSSLTVARDGGRATGQISISVTPSEALNVCRWLRCHPDLRFLAVPSSGPGALLYSHAIVLERTVQGQLIHQGDVQDTLFEQLGVQTAIFYNQRLYRDAVIYAFNLSVAR
jgi:hypothetical protein